MFPRKKLVVGCLAIALAGIAPSALASSDWQIVKVRGRDYLTVDNVAKFYGLPIGVEPVAKRIRLDNGKNEIEVMLDSREVVINGVRNWLCFPVTEKDGKYLISRVDLAKTLEPQLRPQMIKGLGSRCRSQSEAFVGSEMSQCKDAARTRCLCLFGGPPI